MNDPSGMHIVQPAQDLVQEELEVRLLEVLPRVDYVMQVLHTTRGDDGGDDGRNNDKIALVTKGRMIWQKLFA